MSKRVRVDDWRTMYWLRRLLERTNLSLTALARNLLELADPDHSPTSLRKQLGRYLNGEQSALLVKERGNGMSWIVIADRLAPGSLWDFCHPLFDLLQELELWRSPQRAHERFARQIGDEILASEYSRGTTNLMLEAEALKQGRYSRLQRIRRAMLAIEGLPVENLFRPVPPVRGLLRHMRPIREETLSIALPPTLSGFTASLAFYLEALQLGDGDRFLWSRDLLWTTLSAPDGTPSLKFAGKEIRRLIEEHAPSVEDFLQAESDLKVFRTAAPLSRDTLSTRADDQFELLSACADLALRNCESAVEYIFL